MATVKPLVERVISMSETEVDRAARMLYRAFDDDILTSYFLQHLEEYSVACVEPLMLVRV
jgi:hypothetical protein